MVWPPLFSPGSQKSLRDQTYTDWSVRIGREEEESKIISGMENLSDNAVKPCWVLVALDVHESTSNLSLEVVNKHGISFAWLTSCPDQKWLNCIHLNWLSVTPLSRDGRVGDASRKIWGHERKPWFQLLGGAALWLCTPATFCSRPYPFPLESPCLAHMEIWVYRVLWDAGWLVKYNYSVADGWVDKGYRMHPFICIHPMLRFIGVHLTLKIFHGSKFNSCCQNCLLWAGYNWQHLFSFLPNKIICISPAGEKRCSYSFGIADHLPTKHTWVPHLRKSLQ